MLCCIGLLALSPHYVHIHVCCRACGASAGVEGRGIEGVHEGVECIRSVEGRGIEGVGVGVKSVHMC